MRKPLNNCAVFTHNVTMYMLAPKCMVYCRLEARAASEAELLAQLFVASGTKSRIVPEEAWPQFEKRGVAEVRGALIDAHYTRTPMFGDTLWLCTFERPGAPPRRWCTPLKETAQMVGKWFKHSYPRGRVQYAARTQPERG
jgi:hypothetical protein